MLRKLIYLLGVQIRSPEIFSIYKALKTSEAWSLKRLQELQLERLKRIVNIAYNKSAFYRTLLDLAAVKPSDINSIEDLKKIPVVSKTDILKNVSEIQNSHGYRRLFNSETSGSTGEPLVFFRDSVWDASTRAAQLRGYSWYGVNPWEKNGYFWGYGLDKEKQFKIRILDKIMNRFRIFAYDEDEIKIFAKRLEKAAYLEGYSSMIYEVAKMINKNNTRYKFNLKMVKGTSEKIFETYQESALKAFGKKIISEYGSCETGIIAFECPSGNMHVAMENVIVEQEDGEIIVTNLVSDSFPIIRYKLGDSVSLEKNISCSCGMKHEIISEVIGRIGKVIYGTRKRYPSLTLYYVFKNMAAKYKIVLNYQGVQNAKGSLDLYIEQLLSDDVKKKLDKELAAYFSNDLVVNMMPQKLIRDFSGKFKDFVSNIE